MVHNSKQQVLINKITIMKTYLDYLKEHGIENHPESKKYIELFDSAYQLALYLKENINKAYDIDTLNRKYDNSVVFLAVDSLIEANIINNMPVRLTKLDTDKYVFMHVNETMVEILSNIIK